MTPWQALGLTREAAADPAAVRRAYARALKEHRPDRDPEGFRRVRDAYEVLTGPMAAIMLRNWAEEEEDEEDEEDAEDAEDAVETPLATTALAADPPPRAAAPVVAPAPVAPAPAPPPVAPAPAPAPGWEALARRAEDDEADDAGLAAAGRDLLGPTPAPAIIVRLAGILASRPGALAAALDDAHLLAAAAHGGGDAMLTVAAHLEDAGDRRLAALAEAAADSPLVADDGMLLYRLAGFCAIDHPKQARALANAAFRSLPSHLRHLLDQLELRIRLGGEMARWPAPLRRTMLASLESRRLPEEREILRGRLAALPANSALRHAVASAFPKWRIGLPTRSRITSREPEPSGCASGKVGAWVAWIFLVALISRIANCASEPTRPRLPVIIPPSTPSRSNQGWPEPFKPIHIPPPPSPRPVQPAQPR